MGMVNSKDYIRKIDEATSNSSLSNVRYVITEKPKWKVFKKKEIVPLPPNRGLNRCQCGSEAPCKQKVTPRGVTLHYPQPKKKKFGAFGHNKRYTPPKINKNYFNSPNTIQKVKLARPKKFPTWRLDQIACKTPFSGSKVPASGAASKIPASSIRPTTKVKVIPQKKYRQWTLDQISIKLPPAKPAPAAPAPVAPPTPAPPPAPAPAPIAAAESAR